MDRLSGDVLVLLGCHAEPTAWFAGDVHLGAEPRGSLEGLGLSGGGVVNLEGPIADGPGGAVQRETGIQLTNPIGSGGWLAAQGVVAAGVVNNHADDLGEEGARRTRDALRLAGVAAVGPRAQVRFGDVPVTLLAYRVEEGIPAGMAEDLAGAGEWSVVGFHVDGPPSLLPRPALVAAVDAAVNGGADVVVAHGTHALGGVERRGGAIVAWGLGNLVFDCPCTDGRDAIVLEVTFEPGLPARVLPIRAGLGGESPVPGDAGVLDLIDALGLPPLRREGRWARL